MTSNKFTGKLTITPASEADIPVIQVLAQKAFPATYADILSSDQIDYMMDMMYSEPSLLRQIGGNHRFFIATLPDGTPCGYFSIELPQDDSAVYILQKLYLDPAYKGQGIGSKLLDFIFDEVRSLSDKPKCLRVFVNKENSSLDFYHKKGLRAVDQRSAEIGNNFYMCDYILECDL